MPPRYTLPAKVSRRVIGRNKTCSFALRVDHRQLCVHFDVVVVPTHTKLQGPQPGTVRLLNKAIGG
jgi:hypothetical protein